MYINIETNQYPITEQDIRKASPTTSFGEPFTAPEGYAWVFPAPATYDPKLQYAVEIHPVLTDKGHWEQ